MANGKAKTSKSLVDEIKELKREKAKNFGIGRQNRSVATSSGFSLGSSGSKGGTDANDNQIAYVKTAGDTMVGPLAFYPIALTVTDNYFDVSEDNSFSSRVIVTGESASADDVVAITGAAHAGQILFIQATATTAITIKHNAGSGTAWATSTAYVAGDIRTNGGLRYVCHTGHTSSASDEPGVGANWTDYWYKGNIYIPSTNDYTIAGKEIVMLQWDTINETWTIVSNFDDAGGAGSQTPWTSDIDADGFDLVDLSNIEFRETTAAPAGTSPSIYHEATGITLNVPTGDSFTIDINGVAQYQFDATSLQFGTNDLDMGTGNITAGGAGEGATNIGHLDFIDNAATPAAAVSLYSDGTDLFANTGGGTVNLSNIGGSGFVDNIFTIEDNVDSTKKMAFEVSGVTTLTTRTFTVPDANGTLVITPAVQTLDMNNNNITMGTGQITAGGASKGMTNIGTLEFMNNAATPAFNAGFYSDGTDMFARSGGASYNLSDMFDSEFTDAVFRVTDELDLTKKFAVDVTSNTTGTTATLAFAVTANRTITFPDATTTLAGLSTTHTWTGVNTFSQSIVAGGAGEGMTSIGHLDFTDNLATPAAAVSLYSDGTNLLSKSTIDLNGNDLIGVDDITFNLAGQSINTDAVGMAIQVPTGDTIDFLVNGSRMTLSETAFDVKVDLELNANDLLTQGGNINTANGTLTMGTGDIIAGGALKEINNVGELVFVNNTATPADAGAIFFDGTDMKVKTGGGTVNLSDVGGGNFTDATFRVNDELDATKQFIIDVTGNTTLTTATLDFNTSASRIYTFPDVTGEVLTTTGVQSITGAKDFTDDVTLGGAGQGADNAGFITFVDNLATPAAALAIYGDGTDLKVSTGGGTVNLSNLMSNPATADLDMSTFDVDNVDVLNFSATAGASIPTGNAGITSSAAGIMEFNVVAGTSYQFDFAGSTQYSMNSTELNLLANALINFNYLEQDGTAASVGAIRLVNNDGIYWDNVGAGNSWISLDSNDDFNFINNSVTELTFDSSANEWGFGANHIKLANASEVRWEASPAAADITLSVDTSEQMLLRNATKFEFSASSGGATVSNGALDSTMTASSVTVNGGFLYADNIRQTFNPGTTNAGINVGAHTADPSSPTAGDIYYDSTNHKFRIATGASPAWGDLGGGGASALNDLSDVTIGSPVSGQYLRYSGTTWNNSAFILADMSVTSGNIIVGNASNDGAQVTMSGDATISNTGVLSLAANSVGASEIATGAVGGTEIANNSVNIAHLVHQSAGSLYTMNASGTPIILSPGTSGTVLTSNGTGAALTWSTPSGGDSGDADGTKWETHSTTQFDHVVYMSNTRGGSVGDGGAFNIVEDVLYYVPYFVSSTQSVDDIGFFMNNASDQSTFQMAVGIYNNRTDGQNYPGTKVVDGNTFLSGTTNQIKMVNISNTEIGPGLYWFAFVLTNSNVIDCTRVGNGEANNVGYIVDTTATPDEMKSINGFSQSHTSTTLPTTPANDMIELEIVPIVYSRWV